MAKVDFYKWQKKANKVIARCLKEKDNTVIPINACVGSGKTTVASEAFLQFIKLNKKSDTFQMFICPTINLCNQQCKSIKNYFKDTDVEDDMVIKVIHCESGDYNKKNLTLVGKHVIFIMCDESLWGTVNCDDEEIPCDIRYKSWEKKFKKWQREGRKFGAIIYDESHNYIHKQDKMFGCEYAKDGKEITK